MKLTIGAGKRIGATLGSKAPNVTGGSLIDLISAATKKSSGGGGYYVPPTPPQQSDEEVLSGYVDGLYAAYKPSPLAYETQSEDALRAQIAAWLRPSYDKAILDRQERTKTYRAELDADAISRGMGVSSYVSDVKGRQLEKEAADVAQLESEYGASLAKSLSEQIEAEKERALEVAMLNKQNDYDAYMRAYDAALTMFAAYKANGGGWTGGYYTGGAPAVATSKQNCAAFLQMLTPAERKEVYSGTTAQGQQYKNEIIASVGIADYYAFMNQYRPAD